MKRLTNILVILVAFSTALNGTGFADIKQTATVDVNVTMPSLGSGTLSVIQRRITDDVQENLNLTPPNTITLGNPWYVPSQYLEVNWTATYNATFGARIVTDNKVYIGTQQGYVSLPGDKLGSGEAAGVPANWNDGDEILSWAGIISVKDYQKTLDKHNPKNRAGLGWQVYKDKAAKPATPTDSDFDKGTPADPTDDWKANWGYVGDKSDYVAKDDGTLDAGKTLGGLPINLGNLPAPNDTKIKWNSSYFMFGGIGSGLAQHPAAADGADADTEPDAKPADEKLAVYITAKWANKDYSQDVNGTPFLLPAGDYKTRIYIELVAE